MRGKVEPGQRGQGVLGQRGCSAERAGRGGRAAEGRQSGVESGRRHGRDERAILGLAPGGRDPEYYG